MKPGEAATVSGIAARTGVEAEAVETLLQALTRAKMFAQKTPTTFVRERLLKPAMVTPRDFEE
jgi:hypothetical protein